MCIAVFMSIIKCLCDFINNIFLVINYKGFKIEFQYNFRLNKKYCLRNLFIRPEVKN